MSKDPLMCYDGYDRVLYVGQVTHINNKWFICLAKTGLYRYDFNEIYRASNRASDSRDLLVWRDVQLGNGEDIVE